MVKNIGDALLERDLTDKIIGAAIEVHKELGPGLMESVYQACMERELDLRGNKFEKQKALPVEYKGILLDCGYRMDLFVEGKVVVELKCVEALTAVHEAQLLTYLKLAKCRIGLLMNFNFPLMKDGITRRVL